MTTQKTTTTIETNMFNNFIFSRTNDSWGSENVYWKKRERGDSGTEKYVLFSSILFRFCGEGSTVWAVVSVY